VSDATVESTAAVAGVRIGWQQALDKLAALLAKRG
jgi:hypothetical protein